MALRTYAVLGTGTWHSGCRAVDNGYECTGDSADVSGGGIVVKIYSLVGGPLSVWCTGDTAANATLGPNAVLKAGAGIVTWEIRRPGAEFGWQGNISVEAWTSDAATMAQAEALVASFRWAPGVGINDGCSLPTYPTQSASS